MYAILRPVYYCSHCKRHRLTKRSIETHEPRCIYNPDRSMCGWHHGKPPAAQAGDLVKFCGFDLDELRRKMAGCPACILSAVVQADLTIHQREDLDFDYKTEVRRFREEEQREAQYVELY